MPSPWRLIDSDLVSPPVSAALDEAILEAHIAGRVPNTLHFYRRSVPTVSVGYFQRIASSLDLAECRRRKVEIVRRRSGGSTIYTDPGQLIYGLVIHDGDLPQGRTESFSFVCSALARAIGSFGLFAAYRPPNDIEVSGRKVSGNAQFRRQGSVLQHGTILVNTDTELMDAVLRADPEKEPHPTVPSLRITTLSAMLGRVPEMDLVKSRVSSEIARAFAAEFEPARLTDYERVLVDSLVRDRYSRDDWNLKF